jgi:hypothetical protein
MRSVSWRSRGRTMAGDGGPRGGGSRTVKEMAAWWMAVPGAPHDGRVGRGPRMEAVASKESQNGAGGAGGGDGVPAAIACEGNENLPSDSGRKVSPRFIMSSIGSGST